VPCLLCGARQTDPARGASPWKRGVVEGEQVLVCPDCQTHGGWTERLDRCSTCGSVALAKSLGEVVCKACAATGGTVGPVRTAPSGAPAPASGEALHDEVDAALARVLTTPIDRGGRPRRR
jgi:hypothetical protein